MISNNGRHLYDDWAKEYNRIVSKGNYTEDEIFNFLYNKAMNGVNLLEDYLDKIYGKVDEEE